MRRRRQRDPVFGFDSFLDVVANLVGIVIRLMLVVMIGAHLTAPPEAGREGDPGPATVPAPSATAAEVERLGPELAAYRRQVAELGARLLETIRQVEATREAARRLRAERPAPAPPAAARLAEAEPPWEAEQAGLARAEEAARPLKARLAELARALDDLRARPPEVRALRYHLPVSRPVGAGELMFECQHGRVTFADLNALLDQVRDRLKAKGEDLRRQWEVTDTVGPVGAFRLDYTLERSRDSALDRAFGGLPPADGQQFSYGLSRWELRPVWAERGESAEEALAGGSQFRRVVDCADPVQAVFTFWVYPDSFELFRTLRDYLYERGFVVAGRPLPPLAPIAGSRQGTTSRGQ
jgi:hypothetical protein